MFRYLAWAWDPTQQQACAVAAQLRSRLLQTTAWSAAFEQPGMQVWVTGTRAGVNEVHRLTEERGVVLGRLFRGGDLDTTSSDARLQPSDCDAIFRSGGRSMVGDFWGRYVAVLREADGRCAVLRDPSGTLPCFLMKVQGVDIVFSWLEDVLGDPTLEPMLEVHDDLLCTFLVCGEPGGRQSGLRGVTQVLPGERVALGRGTASTTRLWDLVATAQLEPIEDAATAEALLHHIVRSTVRAWASCYERILLRLSGGVDSSIVAACLAAGQTGTEVICVNYHSPGVDSDERHYARQAAARAGLELIERERAARFSVDSILDAALTPSPCHHAARMGSAQLDAELAAAFGTPAMFTGAGGDQLFFEFHEAWPAADYLRAHGPGTGLFNAAMDAARLGRTTVWSAMRGAMADLRRPAELKPRGPESPHLFTDAAIERAIRTADPMSTDSLAHPAVREAVRLPIGKRKQVQQLVHPLGYHDPFARESAPELVNPLLSQPVVELCLRLPTYVLTRGGRARGLARDAFAAELPPAIATRRAKGGFAEHLEAALLDNMDFVEELLLDGELVRRGWVDRRRAESLLRRNRAALAHRAGEVHTCLAVEAWFQRVKRAFAKP